MSKKTLANYKNFQKFIKIYSIDLPLCVKCVKRNIFERVEKNSLKFANVWA